VWYFSSAFTDFREAICVSRRLGIGASGSGLTFSLGFCNCPCFGISDLRTLGMGIHSSLSSSNRWLYSLSAYAVNPSLRIAYPSNSVNVKAFLWYSASKISLYANGIFAGVPSKNVSLNGKIYVSCHKSAISPPFNKATYPILMPILATQHPLSSRVRMVIPRSRNIDEQSTGSINPSCINNI
jgi:hypothetical protein